MEKKNTIINYVFIIIFVIMLFLPLLFLNQEENKVSTIENKILTQRPALYLDDGSLNKFYIAEFEDYFNDNIGFKEEALIANILIKDKIFGVLDIPNWLVGEEGNLFYTSGGEDIATFAGANYFSEETMQNMTENLNYLNQYFEQQGCQTYNMFIPNKEAIYSEFYDSNVYHAENSRMDILAEYVVDHTDLNVINVKDALLANKSEQLYYKSCDASHWNMNGAFIGYQELMYAIKNNNPEIKILEKEDFDITENDYKGLMSYHTDIPAIHNNFDFEDVIYAYNLRGGGYHATVEEVGPDGMTIDPNMNFYHYQNENASTKKKLLIVGDSYIYAFILPLLAESFEDVYFIRNMDVATVVQLTEKVEPDIFVFEVVERACSEGYFNIMSGYSNYLNIPMDMSQYKLLENKSEVYIDLPNVVDGMVLLEEDYITGFWGWTFDSLNDVKPKKLVVKIGDLYRDAHFYYREDLVEWGVKLSECGFNIQIETELLRNVKEIDFFVITNNDEIYEPYSIRINF